MQSRIPLPTDNIYKFYALFGLLLFIFGIGSLIYVNESTNSQTYEIIGEYHTLKQMHPKARSMAQEIKYQILDRKLDDAVASKIYYSLGIGLITVLGILMFCYGFKIWHTIIQPMQDDITRLNIKKLQQEVGEEERPNNT